MQVVIVAGGLGRRMGNLTRHTPKPLLAPPGCPPLIGCILDALRAVRVTRLVVCVGFGASAIRRYLDTRAAGIDIRYVRAPSRGVGYAVSACRDLVSDEVPLLLTMADVICPLGYEPLLQALERADLALAVSEVGPDPDKRYTEAQIAGDGALAFSPAGDGALAGRPLVGVYAIRPVRTFFRILHEHIGALEEGRMTWAQAMATGVVNARGECRLSFALKALAAAGHATVLRHIGPCVEVNRPHHLVSASRMLRYLTGSPCSLRAAAGLGSHVRGDTPDSSGRAQLGITASRCD